MYFTYGIKHSGESAEAKEASATKYQSLVATPLATPTAEFKASPPPLCPGANDVRLG